MEMEIKEKHNGEERKRGFHLFPSFPFPLLQNQEQGCE